MTKRLTHKINGINYIYSEGFGQKTIVLLNQGINQECPSQTKITVPISALKAYFISRGTPQQRLGQILCDHGIATFFSLSTLTGGKKGTIYSYIA